MTVGASVMLLWLHFEHHNLGSFQIFHNFSFDGDVFEVRLANVELAFVFESKHAAQIDLAAGRSLLEKITTQLFSLRFTRASTTYTHTHLESIYGVPSALFHNQLVPTNVNHSVFISNAGIRWLGVSGSYGGRGCINQSM